VWRVSCHALAKSAILQGCGKMIVSWLLLRTALLVEMLSNAPWCILLQVYLERAEQLRNLLQKQ
jgi:hypothetical protein